MYSTGQAVEDSTQQCKRFQRPSLQPCLCLTDVALETRVRVPPSAGWASRRHRHHLIFGSESGRGVCE